MTATPQAPVLEHFATLNVKVGAPLDIGRAPFGQRRIIPILEGVASGKNLSGRVLPGGADFQNIRSATYTDIQARYIIETTEGERIYVENTGIRTGSPEDIEKLARGEFVDPSRLYFRTYPRFETSAERWLWLNDHLFVGTGARHPDRVELNFYVIR